MRTSLRWLSLFMAPALVISLSALMVACSSDDDVDEDVDVALVSSSPAAGADVNEGSTATLNFDGDPGTVTVNGGATEGAGNSRTFTIAQADNSIVWDTGSSTLTFGNVLPPDVDAPALVGVDPDVDGATDVDPATVNDAGITIEYDEPVDADELVISTGGSSLGWIVTTDGNSVTLQANADSPVVNETSYEVTGTVVDGAGNETVEIGRASCRERV